MESGKYGRIALVAATAADARDVMVEDMELGPHSGIVAISPPWNRPVYNPTLRRLTWPNGATATTYSADEPNRLRGQQHDSAWADEVAAWMYPETWDQLMLGLRLGSNPQVVATTTPRPISIIKKLLKDPSCRVTRGSTYDNKANLSEAFLTEIVQLYEGTRLGRQELYAEVLEDNPGALWKRDMIDGDGHRVTEAPADMIKIVVALDPTMTHGAEANEAGISVAGSVMQSNKLHAYVLADWTLKASPDGWARKAIEAYHTYKADHITYEANQGGELVEHTLRTIDPNIPIKKVWASRGKYVRAEPVSALYEQARVHHVGHLPKLEDEMCTWDPEANMPSPNRLDALVYSITDLLIDSMQPLNIALPEGVTRPSHWRI